MDLDTKTMATGTPSCRTLPPLDENIILEQAEQALKVLMPQVPLPTQTLKVISTATICKDIKAKRSKAIL